ncbi:MAG: hypothetical protein GX791_02670 [Synergistaceae bacterium]|nr:hypothetical protein [Synergistaceae bacterium]
MHYGGYGGMHIWFIFLAIAVALSSKEIIVVIDEEIATGQLKEIYVRNAEAKELEMVDQGN